jgi:hypothetical protein
LPIKTVNGVNRIALLSRIALKFLMRSDLSIRWEDGKKKKVNVTRRSQSRCIDA